MSIYLPFYCVSNLSKEGNILQTVTFMNDLVIRKKRAVG